MGIVKRVAKSKSRTIKWGHIQVAIGALGTGVSLITPAAFPNLPTWAYGIALVVSGMITYVLRDATRKPLE